MLCSLLLFLVCFLQIAYHFETALLMFAVLGSSLPEHHEGKSLVWLAYRPSFNQWNTALFLVVLCFIEESDELAMGSGSVWTNDWGGDGGGAGLSYLCGCISGVSWKHKDQRVSNPMKTPFFLQSSQHTRVTSSSTSISLLWPWFIRNHGLESCHSF